MLVRLIWPGKTKDACLRTLIEEYLKRLSRFGRCEVMEVAASGRKGRSECVEEEAERLLNALRANVVAVLLDVDGREWSSAELATEFERWQVAGTKEVAFVVGGAYGVSVRVRERANFVWSLSRLTLTHEMARVVLLEQLYRAQTIIHNLPYQK